MFGTNQNHMLTRNRNSFGHQYKMETQNWSSLGIQYSKCKAEANIPFITNKNPKLIIVWWQIYQNRNLEIRSLNELHKECISVPNNKMCFFPSWLSELYCFNFRYSYVNIFSDIIYSFCLLILFHDVFQTEVGYLI